MAWWIMLLAASKSLTSATVDYRFAAHGTDFLDNLTGGSRVTPPSVRISS